MEKKHVEKAKKWNFIALIIGTIEVILSGSELPSVLSPNKSLYESLGEDGIKLYQQLNSLSTKIFTVTDFILTLMFVVLFFIAYLKFKKEELPMKLPYYMSLVWTLIMLVRNLWVLPGTQQGTANFVIITAIITTVITLILEAPVLLTLINLIKSEVTVFSNRGARNE